MDELLELKKKYLDLQYAFLMQQRQLNALMMADLERQVAILGQETKVSAEENPG